MLKTYEVPLVIMKLSTFAFIGFASLIIGLVPQEAKAFTTPFDKNSCASMQKYFSTKVRWNPSRKFSGFEKSKPDIAYPGPHSNKNFVGEVICDGGYMIETSPMGTRVCRGRIIYLIKAGKRSSSWYAYDEDRGCRWK